MTHRFLLLGAMLTVGCASTPRGPSDATLAQQLQQRVEAAIPDAQARVAIFAPDARLTIIGLPGADGAPTTLDLTGTDQIRAFTTQTPLPPGFAMEFLNFERKGAQFAQTGRWRITGATGTFTVSWREIDGRWLVSLWQMRTP